MSSCIKCAFNNDVVACNEQDHLTLNCHNFDDGNFVWERCSDFQGRVKDNNTKEVKQMILSTDSAERKNTPITSGVMDYFPLALVEVSKCSKAGNDQHNLGQALHWDKSKSTDHADCISRHLIDRGSFDTDGIRHSAKLAWRALALLQIEMENEKVKK
jgi:hypothetical protein